MNDVSQHSETVSWTAILAGVSIVIPAYDEENGIELTLRSIRDVFRQAGFENYEIVIIDDGSADSTAERARSAGACIVRHPHNVGYGRSLKDGIVAAGYDTIVITDADGTYPVEQIPDLLQQFVRGFDMVVGQRTGDHYRESAIKAPLRHILKFLVEYTAGRKIPDINSGLRVFSRATVLPYFQHLCDTFSFTTSLTLAYMMTGKFVAYLPIGYHQRIGKTKVHLFRESLRTLQYIVQAIIYYNPLKIFLMMSALCLLFALFCTVVAMVFQITSAFFLAVGSILVAILIFAMGLLADLLKQIMAK
ncbi:MAG: glycosyltransferase family 2 protein [Pseudomonadota bacterium]